MPLAPNRIEKSVLIQTIPVSNLCQESVLCCCQLAACTLMQHVEAAVAKEFDEADLCDHASFAGFAFLCILSDYLSLFVSSSPGLERLFRPPGH